MHFGGDKLSTSKFQGLHTAMAAASVAIVVGPLPLRLRAFIRISESPPLPASPRLSSKSSSLAAEIEEGTRRWEMSSRLLFACRAKSCKRLVPRAERRDGPDSADVSVFRFTLGIPGFDDAELPTLVGFMFGGLLILNHVFSLDTVTPAQWRSEGVGLVLAAVSVSLSNIGRQLNNAEKSQKEIEPGQRQLFSIADGLSEGERNDFAWVSYNLLRNTSTTAMLVVHAGQVVGARGFWGLPADLDPLSINPLKWLQEKLGEQTILEFSSLPEPLYVPVTAGSERRNVFPTETASMVVQPFFLGGSTASPRGFLLVTSRTAYGYKRKDRMWIAFLAKKLAGILSASAV